MKRSISSIRPWPKNGEERERRNESFPNTVVNSALTPIFVRAIRGWFLEGEGEGFCFEQPPLYLEPKLHTGIHLACTIACSELLDHT